ncbi:hypothetical protein U1Q18_046661 [Sarracenia purpurea var. burkii]
MEPQMSKCYAVNGVTEFAYVKADAVAKSRSVMAFLANALFLVMIMVFSCKWSLPNAYFGSATAAMFVKGLDCFGLIMISLTLLFWKDLLGTDVVDR